MSKEKLLHMEIQGADNEHSWARCQDEWPQENIQRFKKTPLPFKGLNLEIKTHSRSQGRIWQGWTISRYLESAESGWKLKTGHQGREKVTSWLSINKKISKLASGFNTTKASVKKLEGSASWVVREVRYVSRIAAYLTPSHYQGPLSTAKVGNRITSGNDHNYLYVQHMYKDPFISQSWESLCFNNGPSNRARGWFLIHRLTWFNSSSLRSQSLSLPKLLPKPSSRMELARPVALYKIVLILYISS